MSLIICPECGEKVSDTCESCIHCGYRLRNLVINAEAQKPMSEDNADVIAERSTSNGSMLLYILGIILSQAFFGLVVIWCINSSGSMPWFAVLIIFFTFLLGAILLAFSIVELIKVSKAGKLVDDCVVYYKEKNLVEMTQLGGSKIRIAPSDIVDARAGYQTDFMLLVSYVDKNGITRKANLGFTLNREMSVEKILNLKKNSQNNVL